ncbi:MULTISPECIES: nuclease [Staphylococcaceae]|uniref:nuclease n=1 Tax=Staphylococcaceae TaxID=90964 RepID=UPI000CEB85A1|nr:MULTISPECIES: nuclease [Staphylococcaceae]MEB5760072.1 nuclease [Mammaliicoccus sciuri]PPJ69942.1 nuclease [Staphylococcus aureus]PPJ84441.1 nuclease [Staphylococcus aureus]PPJ91533.1 nuclease [Staphylococcus aureus]PPJ91770.1 nuclease [Staphylococcus aureus]
MSKTTTSYRNVRKSKFTQISNDLLNDEQLTLESKALLSIFLSNSDDWDLHMSEIIKRSKNGRDAHYSALKKLIKAGYIARLEFKQNSNNQFLKLEYIFSDNKEDINDGIKEAQIFAIENEQSIILTYKNLDCQKLESSLENKEQSDVEKPFPENPYTANSNTESAYTESQDINNTNSNNTNSNNTNSNGLNGMNGNNIDSISEMNDHSLHSNQENINYLIDEQSYLLKPLPKDLQEFIKSRYTLADSISIIHKIMQAKRAAADRRDDGLFFMFEGNPFLSEKIIDILITVNREMKKKRESVQALLGYYYNALVNGLEEFHFTEQAKKTLQNKKNPF